MGDASMYELLVEDLTELRSDVVAALSFDLDFPDAELDQLSTDGLVLLGLRFKELTDAAFEAGLKAKTDLDEATQAVEELEGIEMLAAELGIDLGEQVEFEPFEKEVAVEDLVEADAVALDAAVESIMALAERLDQFESKLAEQGIFLGA